VAWGIPAVLLLMAGLVDIEPGKGFRLPTYVLGALLLYAGAMHFCRAGSITYPWRRLSFRFLFLVALMVYFAPFVYWSTQAPYETFFVANLLGLATTSVAALYLVNRLAMHVGDVLRDDTFHVEARLSGWALLALTAFPLACLLLYALQSMIRFDSSLYTELVAVHYQTPRWMVSLALLPVVLTVVIAWKAKECCFRHVAKTGAMREPSPRGTPPATTSDPAI